MNKIVELLKTLIFVFYSFITTIYENTLLKKNFVNSKNKLNSCGYININISNRIEMNLNKAKKKSVNEYLNKFIFEEQEIYQFIKKVFLEHNIAEQLTKSTGFNYSINYFTAYETKGVPIEKADKGFYANHWHKDGAYSKNTIKLVIPLEKIDSHAGGMEILDALNSIKYLPNANTKLDITADYVYTSDRLTNFLIFKPNICLHKAGNPRYNNSRKQVVLQLTPSGSWNVHKKISYLQNLREPKFTNLSYFLSANNFISIYEI